MSGPLALADLQRLGWGPALVPITPGSKRPGVSGADAIGWQLRTYTAEALAAAEKRGCSFGVRFNLIPAAALDCDAEGATADAAPVVAEVAARLIGGGATRTRNGTSRFVTVYRTAAVGDGKRVAQFQRGTDTFGVELFHGSGQIVFGPRHASGVPYVWREAPDYDALPVVAIDAERLFAELAKALKPLGYTLAGTVHCGADAIERDPDKREADPLWHALVAQRLVLFEQRSGRAAIRCPFADQHASAKSGGPRRRDSSTAYLPPPADSVHGTGFISCLHASRAGRSQGEFAEALGAEFPADPVVEFPPNPPIPTVPHSPGSTTEGFEETTPPTARRKPSPMRGEAFRGLIGEAVGLFAESCEASREALLLHTLIALSALPDCAGVHVGRARPVGCALQALIVGPSAHARKGTAASMAVELLGAVAPAFVFGASSESELIVPSVSRVLSGVSSGEGLIFVIRDPRQLGKDTDPGSPDKRLLLRLEEFSALLKVAAREGNTLSEIFRQLHDGGALSVPTRRDALQASRSHVAAFAHCTPAELRARLRSVELVNGMANRWLIAYIERGRVEPEPPRLDMPRLTRLANDLRARLQAYSYQPGREHGVQLFELTPAAAALWRDELYSALDGSGPGVIGSALGVRYTAHAKRLALLYALTDGAYAIGVEHLRAAVAVLGYCEESVAYLFGADALTDPVTQRVADLIREGQGALVPRASLWRALGHRVKAAEIDTAIAELHAEGRIRVVQGPMSPNRTRPWLYGWRV